MNPILKRPELPPHLAELFDKPERYEAIDNSLTEVAEFVRAVGA